MPVNFSPGSHKAPSSARFSPTSCCMTSHQNRTRNQTLLYADDVEADVTASTNAEAEALLNPYLDAVSEWAREWRFDFSVKKSALVVFTRDAARHPPYLFIMGNGIEARESIKFLGLTFDRKL